MINDFQISEHFNLREFANRKGEVKLETELVNTLEELRKALQHPMIIITSGYRSPADNEELATRLGWIEDGGLVSKDSQHMEGKAADIIAYNPHTRTYISPTRVAEVASKLFSFVKAYEAHTHVDVR